MRPFTKKHRTAVFLFGFPQKTESLHLRQGAVKKVPIFIKIPFKGKCTHACALRGEPQKILIME